MRHPRVAFPSFFFLGTLGSVTCQSCESNPAVLPSCRLVVWLLPGSLLEHADSGGGVLLPCRTLALQLRAVPHTGAPRHCAPVPELSVVRWPIATVPLIGSFVWLITLRLIYTFVFVVFCINLLFCMFPCMTYVCR